MDITTLSQDSTNPGIIDFHIVFSGSMNTYEDQYLLVKEWCETNITGFWSLTPLRGSLWGMINRAATLRVNSAEAMIFKLTFK